MIVGIDSHNAILKHARFLHFLLQTDMGSTVWESSVQCRLYEFSELFCTVVCSLFVHADKIHILNPTAFLFPHYIRVLLKCMTGLSGFSLLLTVL